MPRFLLFSEPSKNRTLSVVAYVNSRCAAHEKARQ